MPVKVEVAADRYVALSKTGRCTTENVSEVVVSEDRSDICRFLEDVRYPLLIVKGSLSRARPLCELEYICIDTVGVTVYAQSNSSELRTSVKRHCRERWTTAQPIMKTIGRNKR